MENNFSLKVKDLGKGGKIMAPAKTGDAGYDVVATQDVTLYDGHQFKMPLGIAIEIPEGFVAIVQGKSGLATNKGLTTIGNVIDSGYRGEISACLLNNSYKPIVIHKGDKVAQIIFQKVYVADIEMVIKLSSSDRNEDGFGSTGK